MSPPPSHAYSVPAILQTLLAQVLLESLISLFLETSSLLMWTFLYSVLDSNLYSFLSIVTRCHPTSTSSDGPRERGAGHLKP